MIVSLSFCRRSLLTGAALLVAVAIVIVAGVIGPVKTSTFPEVTPEKAVPAFLVTTVVILLIATILVLIGIRTTGRSHLLTAVLVLLALFLLLLTFAFVDAASACRSHSPALDTASTLLFVCAAADFIAALLVTTTALLFPKRT